MVFAMSQVLAESKARGVHANNRVMFMFLRAAGSAALSQPQVAAVFAEVAALRARCQLERRSAPAPAFPVLLLWGGDVRCGIARVRT